MQKLNVAILGQGRSGKNIHGVYFKSADNEYYTVKYVVDFDADRRALAEKNYPGCQTFADYRDLFEIKDIDLVVNCTYSQTHYSITKEFLEHGFNVLVEKPFGRSTVECDELIKISKEKGVVLAVFQQTFFAPFYQVALEKIAQGKLGEIKQISLRYNGFSRRWDWQTLQKKVAGGLYNTGPHPIGLALGFLDFDKNITLEYSKLGTALTSGDSDDYAKLILTAPGKPVCDVEVISCDAFSDYNIKIMGSKGSYKSTTSKYKMVYITDGENPDRPVVETFLADETGEPIYCSEKLIKHEEEGEIKGTAFDVGSATLYKQLYYAITEGKEMEVTPEIARAVINIIEQAHAKNPLPLKF